MPWLICPEDDRLIEINGRDDSESLTEMADHIFSAHAMYDPHLVGPLLEQVELIA